MDRLRRFIARARNGKEQAVLDLGCGPGPTTALLVDGGFRVTAVDFSRRSLEVNVASLTKDRERCVFVQADMREILFHENSADGLMMADFLQHLGGTEVQRGFLHSAFAALKPGGWFYLTFFNTNIVNRMKGDVVGSFSNGQIPYRRLSAREVRGMLPENLFVGAPAFSNIFHDVWSDRIATALPGAGLLARMVILSGRKV
jgi:ubiquinone/menaquinone biosynthesis C-methylase UbiE